MNFGQQLEVPQGLGSLESGVRYYYCGRSVEHGVLLVWFYRSKQNNWRVGHLHMSQEAVEKEITNSPPGIRPCKKQQSLPPGLAVLEGINFEEIPESCQRKKTHLSDVQHRLKSIYPILNAEQEVLQAREPLKAISTLATRLKLGSHVYRLQYWFFCYVLHGRNPWALKPETHLNGIWSRCDEKHASKKFGRPHANGERRGWSSTYFREEVEDIYLKKCGIGVSMRSIYREAMVSDFGCIEHIDDKEVPKLIQPENKPFPSEGQFRQIVVFKYGLDQVQRSKYGQARMRKNSPVDEGSYTSQYGNALESMEVDAYHCDDRPIASLSDATMPSLIVARAICGVTGKRLGIGFSLGGERQEAYRCMLVSMTMSSEQLARLYGVPEHTLRGHEPCMTRSLLSDRGPAGQQSLLEGLQKKFPVKAITPSYSGQSKPTIESSNPRSVVLEGAPSYVQSSHSVASMMKREVMRTFAENHGTNIIDRLVPATVMDFHQLGYPATPHFYWKYLSERLRTCAQHMDWRDAVRAFGTQMRFTVDKAGVNWKHLPFSSEAFRAGLHEKLVRRGVLTVKGYTLNLVLTRIWVEIDGQLHELEPHPRAQIDGEELLFSMAGVVDLEKARAEVASATREAAQAAMSGVHRAVKQETGLDMYAGRRRTGTPKKGGTGSAEANALQGSRTMLRKRA